MKSKTFRLFVSSTFNDFIEERNILNKEVYPVIRDFCQEMGYDFQIVDLRWGVNHESAIAQNTMEICLTEVQRCRDYSPRPSFFVMIGERYGWCPLPYRIPSNSFREILNVIGSQMREKLCMWYKEDLNHIGGEYRLISRGGIYSDDKVWEQTENEIREILRFAAFKTENEQLLKHVQASATAQEIYEGVFTRVKHSDHVIAFIRGVMNTGVSESDDIITLRNQVRKKLTDDGNDRNLFTLSLGMPAYADTFKCKTIELIKENIRQEIVRLERSNDNNLDKLYRSYLPDNSIMIDCAPRINTLKDYCFGLSARPLYVMGEPGSGKTTLLAILLEELQKSQNPPDVFYCLYGMDENSFSIISALCEIVRKIVLRYGIVCRRSLDKHSISLALEETLNLIPAGQNAVIVLDGVDGMNDLDDIHEQLLPVTLQSNVKVIVSSADQNVASKLGFVPEIDKNAVVLNQFLPKDCYNGLILELKNINRTITESSQKDQILMAFKNGATPLHVKLAAAICSRWSSMDTAPYLARPSPKLCKPPKWCRIGAPDWRFTYEWKQKESQPGRAGPESKNPGTPAGEQHQQHGGYPEPFQGNHRGVHGKRAGS